MWWSRAIAAVALAAVLGGCGFEPLYAKRGSGEVPHDFAAIQIDPIEERVGQELRNHLLRLLQPRGRLANPVFILEIEMSEGRQGLGVRKTGFASRASLRVTAQFTLRRADNREIAFTSDTLVNVSFNIFNSEFATLMAERDARTKAVQEIGEDIRVRLGAFFNQLRQGGS